MSINKKRGSIALARSLCYQINGAADEDDDMDGGGYGSVDVAEILSAEIERLREALAQPKQEPSQWRDMVVVSLVREGVNKHRARELADHFAAQPEQEPVAIHQFRAPHCADWYDGIPDHHDGYGPYEVRTLYTAPPAVRNFCQCCGKATPDLATIHTCTPPPWSVEGETV